MISLSALSSCRTASAARCWKIAQAASVRSSGHGQAQTGRSIRPKWREFAQIRAGVNRGFPTPQRCRHKQAYLTVLGGVFGCPLLPYRHLDRSDHRQHDDPETRSRQGSPHPNRPCPHGADERCRPVCPRVCGGGHPLGWSPRPTRVRRDHRVVQPFEVEVCAVFSGGVGGSRTGGPGSGLTGRGTRSLTPLMRCGRCCGLRARTRTRTVVASSPGSCCLVLGVGSRAVISGEYARTTCIITMSCRTCELRIVAPHNRGCASRGQSAEVGPGSGDLLHTSEVAP